MSHRDPRKEIREILDLCNKGLLPKKAKPWALGALATASSILSTITDMEQNGQGSTQSQIEALKRIHAGACRWLHREP